MPKEEEKALKQNAKEVVVPHALLFSFFPLQSYATLSRKGPWLRCQVGCFR